jgi:ATP-binding cassette, subfamily A (ABC1), member 3
MDVVAKRTMWRTLAEVAPGRSILLTTHSMEEADTLATRAAIISKRLLAIGSTQFLRQRYSNVYHVQLVLGTAPMSTAEEMRGVEAFVGREIPDAVIDGHNLGGLVKFTIPASSPEVTASSNGATWGVLDDSEIVPQGQSPEGGRRGKSLVVGLIEKLEAHKEELGLAHYSVGATTLERVFMNVIRENNVGEEEPKKSRWRHWW